MGGKIFEGTRRVTPDDVSEVLTKIRSNDSNRYRDVRVIGSFNNMKTRGEKDMGDLDLLVMQRADGSLWSRHSDATTAIDQVNRLFDFESGLEFREDGKTSVFVKRNGIQIDIHFVGDERLFEWIQKATTVPLMDTFKPLYRNEILFHLPRYYSVEDTVVNSDGSVQSYSRDRFTLWEGPVHSKYEFSGRAKSPKKIHDKADLYTKFEDFMKKTCRLDETAIGNPTFSNILYSVHDKNKEVWTRLCQDLCAAFTKKGVEIPYVLR